MRMSLRMSAFEKLVKEPRLTLEQVWDKLAFKQGQRRAEAFARLSESWLKWTLTSAPPWTEQGVLEFDRLVAEFMEQ